MTRGRNPLTMIPHSITLTIRPWGHPHSLSKTFLFQTIQFSISTQFSSIWAIDRVLSAATTLGKGWTGEQWQWRGTLHSSKLQNYWSLTIRLFSVISRILIVRRRGRGGALIPLQRSSRCILQSWRGVLLPLLECVQVVIDQQ